MFYKLILSILATPIPPPKSIREKNAICDLMKDELKMLVYSK